MTSSRPDPVAVRRAAALLAPIAIDKDVTMEIVRWTAVRNPAGTLLAFFSLRLPSGLVIHDLKLMVGQNGTRWVAMPSVRRRDRDDQPILDTTGKPVFDQIIEFRDKD